MIEYVCYIRPGMVKYNFIDLINDVFKDFKELKVRFKNIRVR